MVEKEGVIDIILEQIGNHLLRDEHIFWRQLYAQVDSWHPLQLLEKTGRILEKHFGNSSSITFPLPDWMIEINLSSPLPEETYDFLSNMFPHPQENPSRKTMRVYAPCAFGVLERRLLGPEILAFWEANHHDVSLGKARQKYEKKGLFLLSLRLWQKIHGLVNQIKQKYSTMIPLSTSMHFYEEGLRFYSPPPSLLKENFKGKLEVTIFAGTPGTILPHEFYGEEFYPYASAQNLSPELLEKDLSPWKKVLNAFIDDNPTKKAKINPLRPIYFLYGIGNAPHLEIHYHIRMRSAEKVKNTIKKEYAHDSKFLQQAEQLFDYFRSRNIKFYIIDDEKSGFADFISSFPLLSNYFLYRSERDEGRKKIIRGDLFNIYLLDKIGAAVSESSPLWLLIQVAILLILLVSLNPATSSTLSLLANFAELFALYKITRDVNQIIKDKAHDAIEKAEEELKGKKLQVDLKEFLALVYDTRRISPIFEKVIKDIRENVPIEEVTDFAQIYNLWWPS